MRELRVIIEMREDHRLILAHEPGHHRVQTAGEFLSAIEISKRAAISELMKWLPSPPQTSNDSNENGS